MTETPERQETLDRLQNLPSVIHTPRLTIAPLKPSDVTDFADAFLETWDDMHRWTTLAPYPVDKALQKQSAETMTRLEEFQLRKNFFMGARAHGGEKILSFITLYDVSDDARKMQAGYWTRESAKGRGYTTEAMTGLLHWAYQKVGATMVTARCQDGHTASEKILTKLGFEFTRMSEEPVETSDGRTVHEKLFMHNKGRLPPLDLTFGG